MVLAAVFPSCYAGTWRKGFYTDNDQGKNSKITWKNLIRDLESADHQLEIHIDGKISIGVGKLEDGVFSAKLFTLDELGHYFKIQKHKDFVVVRFHKRPNGTPQDMVKKLNQFFRRQGYKRVMQVGCHTFGIIVESDLRWETGQSEK